MWRSVVPDFERGLRFYRDLHGFEVVQEGDWDGDHPLADQAIGLDRDGRPNGHAEGAERLFVELWEYSRPEPADRRQRPCDYGYPHFALQVDGIEAEYDRLSAAGMEFAGPPVNFGDTSAIYGKGPVRQHH